ncbi:Translocase of chloroplast 159, chloroplastic [Apostasia shenzhenica]|uniref:Translocase of chloroplast 159, chloroplastic n=1 Tax=Apostasia shenzhenica TaxID=1088818 RepID=A0A2I0ASB1_9ASPA|nr:Translocase of chloroplast 159, chloroplastic [Apostasia shenzhenica]
MSLYPPSGYASAPLAIRARLSTEDSASDASSTFAHESDDGGSADNGEDIEEGFRTVSEASEELEDGEASPTPVRLPRVPFMPIARITGDDDDGDVLEVEFDEEVQLNSKLPLENLVAESSSLGGGFLACREESEFSAAMEDFEEVKKMASDIDDANADEGYAEWKNVENESSIMESGKTVDLVQKFDLMVELKHRESAKETDKYVKNGEDAAQFVQIKAAVFPDMRSKENWDKEAELEALEAEFSESDIVKNDLAVQVKSGNGLNEGNTVEAREDDFAECKVSEVAQLYGSEHFKLDEDQSQAGNDRDLFVIADPEASQDSAFKIHIINDSQAVHGICYTNAEVAAVKALNHPEQGLIDVEDKHDESGLFASEGFSCMNCNSWEFSSDHFSPVFVSRKGDSHVYKEEYDFSEEKVPISEWPARFATFDDSETAKYILKEMEKGSPSSLSGFGSSTDYSPILDSHMVPNSDEDMETDEDNCTKELFHTSALAALLHASSGLSGDFPNLRSTNIFTSTASEFAEDTNDVEKKLHLKVGRMRAKYLYLLQRLGYSPKDTLPYQVLHRLGTAERASSGGQMSHEAGEEKDNFGFSCNILLLGKSGVGKSSVINSIFNEEKAPTNPFEAATTSVREISGMVDGVFIRFIDSPGLRTSLIDQRANRKILLIIKKYVTRFPPDIVLYIDRIDIHTQDFDDLPVLRMITNILGRSIWSNSIVAFTHAASPLADGPDGSSLSYEMFVAQRSHLVQQCICQAAGDIHLTNPVALVENHPSCSTNERGEMMLPNGLRWRPHLLLLCYSSKILSELNSLLKLGVSSPKKFFRFFPSCPLSFFLSSLLQSKARPKLSTQAGRDEVGVDGEQDDEYGQFPFFTPLSESQNAEPKNEQKKASFDRYDDRTKLLQKQQWEEEIKRLKNMEGWKEALDFEHATLAAHPFRLCNIVLPPSFDCDNLTYRYRFLEPTSNLLIRPMLDIHSWDHDCNYDGTSIQGDFHVVNQFPMSVVVQIKDKRKFGIYMESSIAAKHGENCSSLVFFSIHPVGKQLAYPLQVEAKFEKPKNSANAETAIISFGETMIAGLKLVDKIQIGKKLNLVASTGAVEAQGGVAYGANLEARLREVDCFIGQTLSSTLALSLVKWRGGVALGADLKSQFSIGRNSKMEVGVVLTNRSNGRLTIKTSSTEQLCIAYLGLFPFVFSICRFLWPGETNLAK